MKKREKKVGEVNFEEEATISDVIKVRKALRVYFNLKSKSDIAGEEDIEIFKEKNEK